MGGKIGGGRKGGAAEYFEPDRWFLSYNRSREFEPHQFRGRQIADGVADGNLNLVRAKLDQAAFDAVAFERARGDCGVCSISGHLTPRGCGLAHPKWETWLCWSP